MIRHQRLVESGSPQAYRATDEHLRAHLSAIADLDEDPTVFAAEVVVRHYAHPSGGIMLVGELETEPQVRYHQPDFDPYEGVPERLRAEARDDG